MCTLLTLWKDADARIPILKESKGEMRTLLEQPWRSSIMPYPSKRNCQLTKPGGSGRF